MATWTKVAQSIWEESAQKASPLDGLTHDRAGSIRALAAVAVVTLLIPLVRFGPRYLTLARGADPQWSDTALERDSSATAGARAQPAGGLREANQEILESAEQPTRTVGRFLG